MYDLDEIFVGRKHPEQEIHVDLSSDLKVSRTHARIWRTRGICWVEDLSSTHGTLVNGEALSGARVVKPEDEVRIGGAMMRVRYDNGHMVMPKRKSETRAFETARPERAEARASPGGEAQPARLTSVSTADSLLSPQSL